MSHIKSLYEEVAAYLAAGEKLAAYELIERSGLENHRAQMAAVYHIMKPQEKPIGSNGFRYRKLMIQQAQRKAQEQINGRHA